MKLEEDRRSRKQHEDEKFEMQKELSETQNQLEDDIDTEIENMKKSFEEKLSIAQVLQLAFRGFFASCCFLSSGTSLTCIEESL